MKRLSPHLQPRTPRDSFEPRSSFAGWTGIGMNPHPVQEPEKEPPKGDFVKVFPAWASRRVH